MNPEKSLLVKGGHVVDPATGHDGKADILVEKGVVARRGSRLKTGSIWTPKFAGAIAMMLGVAKCWTGRASSASLPIRSTTR